MLEEGRGEVGGVYLCQLCCPDHYYCYFPIILCTFTRTLWVASRAPGTGPEDTARFARSNELKRNPRRPRARRRRGKMRGDGWQTLSLSLGLMLAILNEVAPQACPAQCSCSGSTVDCHGLALRSVPRNIPRNTERL